MTFIFRLYEYLFRKFNLFYQMLVKSKFSSVGKEFSLIYPAIVLGAENIVIGNNFYAHKGLRIETFNIRSTREVGRSPIITIGNNVCINTNCHIGAINNIEIKDNVLIGSNVLIKDHQHGRIDLENLSIPPSLRKLYSKGPVVIEENVWIGDGVKIMPGVRIGKNAIIGANAVVTKDIPDNCVAVGIPAVVVRRF